MEYGIVIAIDGYGEFQVVGVVSSREEAKELATNYVNIGADLDYVPPFEFQIHRRGEDGRYTIMDVPR